MRRHGELAKENRRPPGTGSNLQQARHSNLVRRPLGERKPCNRSPGSAPDVPDALKWLQATVAQSRVIAAAAAASKPPGLRKDSSPPRSSSAQHSAPPAAQPSSSPDIVRKKASSRELDGCFGVGPVVKGDVKDRRKSKPRALLTVEALPKVATFIPKEKKVKEIPRPGRASLEWISDDPDTESTTDISAAGGSSGDSSLCSGFLQQDLLERWHNLRASKIYSRLELDSDNSLTDSWDTLPLSWHDEKVGSSPLSEVNSDRVAGVENLSHGREIYGSQVMGAYESCPRGFGSSTLSLVDQWECEQECNRMGPSIVELENALHRMSFSRVQGAGSEAGELADASPANGVDSGSQQVRLSIKSLKHWQDNSCWYELPEAVPDWFKVAVAAGFLVTGVALALAVYFSQRRFYIQRD